MSPLERKKLQDRIQKEFTNYKGVGSTLLQTGRIDSKEYYERVRNKGIQLGLIGEDEYPTTLPSALEPVMRVTGATIGALAGIRGGLTGASAGAGVGGAAATALFQEFSEFMNPDLPMMPMGEKMKRVGTAGAVDAGGTLAFGIAGNAIGGLINRGKQLSSRGATNLSKRTDEELNKIGNSIPERKVGILTKFLTSQTDENIAYMNKLSAEVERQGLTPALGMVAKPAIRAYFQAAGRMPVAGTPQRELYDENIKNMTSRLVDGLKVFNQQGKATSLKPLLSRSYSVNPQGKIVSTDGTLLANLQQEQAGVAIRALTNRLNDMANVKSNSYKVFDDTMKTVGKVDITKPVNIGTAEAPINVPLSKLITSSRSNPLRNRADTPKFNASKQFDKDLRDVTRGAKLYGQPASLTGQQVQRLYTEVRKKVTELESREVRGRTGQEVVNMNVKTSLEQFRTLQSALEQRLTRVRGANGINPGAILNEANKSNAKLKNNIALNAPLLAYLGKSNSIVKSMNSKLDGSMDDILSEAGFQFAKKSPLDKKTDIDLVTTYFDDLKMQPYLKETLGKEQYKKMVMTDMDDIFERSLFKNINAKGSLDDVTIKKELGLDGNKARKRLIEERLKLGLGEKEGKVFIKELDNFVNVLKYLPDNPRMSEFVTRRAVLMSAGAGLGIGALGIGAFSSGAGITGSLMTLGLVYQMSKFLSQPYGKSLLKKAQLKGVAGREAGKEFWERFANENKTATAFNKNKSKLLATLNPASYNKMLEVLRQSGIELSNDELLPNQKSNFYGNVK